MRKLFAVLVGLVLTVALAVGASAAQVEAVGSGAVRVTPDCATLSVGVSRMDADVQTAQGAVNESIEAVRQALVKQGVAREDIAVESIFIFTNYDYSQVPERLIGYNVSHQLSITVRDLDNLGAVIDAALGAGANQLNGVSFTVTDDSAAYATALQRAVASAEAHAKVIAEAAGLTLGGVASLTESSFESWIPTARAMAADGGMGSAPTTVDVGDLVVSARVTAVFDAE